MKNIGVVSYNINCNFTNYGSALQSWALCRSIDRIGNELGLQSKLIDYCPAVLEDCNVLNPYKRMWDTDEESRRMVELTMPAIRENYIKFEEFYTKQFRRTRKKYHDNDFEDVVNDEGIDGFVCGSDTIFCISEFKGFVEGYYANFDCMKGKSVSYAASFGDPFFTELDYLTLNERLKNFMALSIRESGMLDYLREHSRVKAEHVIDPTLLLPSSCYESITPPRIIQDRYLLYYSRRYNKKMELFAERLAKSRGLKFVEISLRATNEKKGHIMRYDAGVEEFLSLVKYSECVVTNSFHGVIFAVHFNVPFYCFTREQGDTKTGEVLSLLGLWDHVLIDGTEKVPDEIDFDAVHARIAAAGKLSGDYLRYALGLLVDGK